MTIAIDAAGEVNHNTVMESKSKTVITVQVTRDFRDQVAAAAEAEQRTIASYIKRALVLYMEETMGKVGSSAGNASDRKGDTDDS